MPLVPDPKNCDISVKRAIQGLSNKLGYTGSPTFANTYITNVITASTSVFSKTCTLAAGLNVLRVTGLQTDATALTGTLRGAYIDVSNGSTEATGTIRALELKARTEAPGDTGSKVAVLEGLSISADSKAHSVTTMRAAEFILDGKTAGTIDEAVGLRIANNLQVDKATLSYGLQIYRDSFDYTYDISLSLGGHITGDSYVNQDVRTTATPTFNGLLSTGVVQATDFAKTGWPITTGATFSFTYPTFKVTDGGSAYYYIDGVKYTLGGDKTVDITDTEGLWYIYFDGATLTASQTIWSFRDEDKALVAILYWDATNNEEIFLGWEAHTFHMDGSTHARLHYAGGARWETGLLVSDNEDDTVDVSAGDIWDEDLNIPITDDDTPTTLFEQILSPARLPIYYRDGASAWRIYEIADKDAVTDVGYIDAGDSDNLKWNDATGTWSNETVGLNNYVAYYVVATNEQAEPIALIMGQRVDNKLSDAKVNNVFSGLSLAGLPFQEMVVLARLILKDTATYTLEEVLDLRAYNVKGNITSPLITQHAGLGGLNWSSAGHYFDAAVDFNAQNISNIGTVGCGVITQSGVTLAATYQPLDDVLTDLAALTAVADNEFIVGTGAGTYAHESGATARTSIGLGTGDSPTFNQVTLGIDPVNVDHSVTKSYADALVAGAFWADVTVGTIANVSLANGLEAGDTIDDYVLVEDDRVLVKEQTDQTENGLYVVPASGAASRAADADTAAEIEGKKCIPLNGTVTQYHLYFCITGDITLGVTDIKFAEVTMVAAHNTLTGIQGGTTNQYYHLTSAEHVELNAWLDDVVLSNGGALSLGTSELTCGSINRAADTLTLEINGTAEVSITATTVTLGGNLIIPNGGTIGSVGDTDVMTIDASGNTTFSVFPITPSAAPDANYEVANKKYVDDNIGTAFSIVLTPQCSCGPATNFATHDTIAGGSTPAEVVSVLDFDPDASEYKDFKFALPSGYAGGGLTVTTVFSMTSDHDEGTPHKVRWEIGFARIDDDGIAISADHAYAFNGVSANVPSVLTEVSYDNITFTDGADMDSLAAGEMAILRIYRDHDHADDNATGDAELQMIMIKET